MNRSQCIVWLAACLSTASVGVGQIALEKGAYLATTYNKVKSTGGEIRIVPFDTPVILVTMRHYVPVADIESGKVFELRDATTGDVIPVTVDQLRSPYTFMPPAEGATPPPLPAGTKLQGAFILGGQLSADRKYRLHLAYDTVTVWDWDGIATNLPIKVTGTKDEMDVQLLDKGVTVGNFGALTPESDLAKAQFGAAGSADTSFGMSWLLDHGKLTLTPETAESNRELGLKYAFEYAIDQKRFGTSIPSRFSLDVDIDGRETSDRRDPGFMGYSRGDLNLRLMALPGSERYYPLGVRAAIGYESDENFRTIARTATAQVVLTVPYIDDLLLGWHRAFGVNRAFAPPVVSAGVVYSGGTAGSLSTGDRWEFEVAWIAPVAEKWDFNIRWRYYDFFSSSMKNQEFMEIGFTYFTSEDRSQGMTLSIEDGFRPLIGDLGSTVLLGYMVRGF